jgi:hypothetical protein
MNLHNEQYIKNCSDKVERVLTKDETIRALDILAFEALQTAERLRAALVGIADCKDSPSLTPEGDMELGLHCGVEDRGCSDRYEGANVGFEQGMERGLELASNEAKGALEIDPTNPAKKEACDHDNEPAERKRIHFEWECGKCEHRNQWIWPKVDFEVGGAVLMFCDGCEKGTELVSDGVSKFWPTSHKCAGCGLSHTSPITEKDPCPKCDWTISY